MTLLVRRLSGLHSWSLFSSQATRGDKGPYREALPSLTLHVLYRGPDREYQFQGMQEGSSSFPAFHQDFQHQLFSFHPSCQHQYYCPSTTEKNCLVTLETGAHCRGALGSSQVWRLSHSTSSSSAASLWFFFYLVSFWELHGDVYVVFYYFLSILKSVILSLNNSLVQKSRMVFQHSTNRSRGKNQGHEHKKTIENPFKLTNWKALFLGRWHWYWFRDWGISDNFENRN